MVQRKTGHGLYTYLTITIAALIINFLLSRFAIAHFPSAPGVSALYFAIAVMVPFTLWFGLWGAIAAYLGCFLGAGLGNLPLALNLYWSLADVWVVLISLVAFRKFKADAGLKSRRDFMIYYVFSWFLGSLAGAVWGSASLAVGGIIPWSELFKTFYTWLSGDLAVMVLITPLLLRFVTPLIVKAGWYVKGYWPAVSVKPVQSEAKKAV